MEIDRGPHVVSFMLNDFPNMSADFFREGKRVIGSALWLCSYVAAAKNGGSPSGMTSKSTTLSANGQGSVKCSGRRQLSSFARTPPDCFDQRCINGRKTKQRGCGQNAWRRPHGARVGPGDCETFCERHLRQLAQNDCTRETEQCDTAITAKRMTIAIFGNGRSS